jgi:exopolysaccharide biosynthesis polyprenyl glycosylphosphotransferase
MGTARNYSNIIPETLPAQDLESESYDADRQSADAKAQRMMEIHLQERFRTSLTVRRNRFLLASWIVRSKLIGKGKRLFDILVSLAVLPFMLPIMMLTALAIKLESRGPVFYMQERVGKWGKKFYCYKFRSMQVDADQRKAELMAMNEADEVVFKMKQDPRVTRVGRIIRKLSIDELPQIFNVLKGEMSLVGPRPPVPIEVIQYTYDQYRRLDATPGITGLQQVSGRSDVSFKRWVELDIQYIEEQSLLKDIEILVRTIPAVISGKGAY